LLHFDYHVHNPGNEYGKLPVKVSESVFKRCIQYDKLYKKYLCKLRFENKDNKEDVSIIRFGKNVYLQYLVSLEDSYGETLLQFGLNKKHASLDMYSSVLHCLDMAQYREKLGWIKQYTYIQIGPRFTSDNFELQFSPCSIAIKGHYMTKSDKEIYEDRFLNDWMLLEGISQIVLLQHKDSMCDNKNTGYYFGYDVFITMGKEHHKGCINLDNKSLAYLQELERFRIQPLQMLMGTDTEKFLLE
jgi:hypothetical protein